MVIGLIQGGGNIAFVMLSVLIHTQCCGLDEYLTGYAETGVFLPDLIQQNPLGQPKSLLIWTECPHIRG